ncbi:acetyl-CoA carboxylase biotin carboxyl carrier protein subunit [Rudanella lutea]|uniref:acetyl-CoA carboxylase biotin carboxyl carrier protein subunit n=1 Tax=Rudanella lutea TaxID=451374 RepID=UPI00037BDFF0|nr:acetyl-CoA carboxylase biotin carboxyl carrier protein subunit [Rudanella lutea]
MFTATVNDAAEAPFSIQFTANGPLVNDEPFAWDLARLNDNTFHILHQNRSYTAELIELDSEAKTVKLSLNGHLYTVQLKDRFDQLLEQMGMSGAASAKINDIKAPMPGLIVGVSVQPGDVVKKGDAVLILEAMKMENLIKSPGEGTIRAIRVAKGDRVEKNQVLIEF